VQRLNEAGCDNARLDAQVLLCHVLHQDRSWLFAHHEYPLDPFEAEQFTELVARRVCREPVAYLIGRKEFYGIDFYVDQRVLIPRPETEGLVVRTIDLCRDASAPRIVDVGTGSGAIAVTLAKHLPRATLVATDISPAALAVARANAERQGVAERIEFVESDLLADPRLAGPWDVIVSNPPLHTGHDVDGRMLAALADAPRTRGAVLALVTLRTVAIPKRFPGWSMSRVAEESPYVVWAGISRPTGERRWQAWASCGGRTPG
jgi:release factor glutamine methyltransferase